MTVIDDSVAVPSSGAAFRMLGTYTSNADVIAALETVPIGNMVFLSWSPYNSLGEFSFLGLRSSDTGFIGVGVANSLGENPQEGNMHYVTAVGIRDASTLYVSSWHPTTETDAGLRSQNISIFRNMVIRAQVPE